MLQLTVLLLLQAHQEMLCWGNQDRRVTLEILVLKVFLVSEGNLGSLDIQGVVISLDVMGQVEEVSPDYLSAKVMTLELVSLVTSPKLGRDLCASFRHRVLQEPPLQSNQGDSRAIHMGKSQFS